MKLHLVAKTSSRLYHLVTQARMAYILQTDCLRPYNYQGGISTTRDPQMTDYTGSQGMILFRLVIDRNALAKRYRIKPVVFKSQTGVVFEEAEDFIVAPEGIPQVSSYLIEIQIISEAMEQWRAWMSEPEDGWDRRQVEEFEMLMKRLPSFARVVEK
jgi:hypothetical protein